jgi:hypothetical protein
MVTSCTFSLTYDPFTLTDVHKRLEFEVGGPSTTSTVPVDFGLFYGAIGARKYGQHESSIAEREEFISLISFINSIAASLPISLKNIDYI